MRLLRPSSWPLAARMACDLLLVALVPLLVATWLSASRSRAALASEARQNLGLLAQVTATRLDQFFVDAQRALEQLAQDERVIAFAAAPQGDRAGLEPALAERLALAARSNPDYAFAMLVTPAGDVIATTEPSTVGGNYGDRLYVRAVVEAGKPYVSELLVGRTTLRPGVFVSSPVVQDGTLVGVMVIKLQGERIADLVAAATPSEGSIALLTEGNGVVIASSRPELLYTSISPLSSTTLAALDPQATYLRDTIPVQAMPELVPWLVDSPQSGSGDVARIGDPATGAASTTSSSEAPFAAGFAPLQTRRWTVTVLQPHVQFAAPIDALRRQQWLILVAVAALAAAYAIWRARGIVRPVLSLMAAAGRVALGDFDARATVVGEDELGRLGRSFNAMVPRLREHVELRQSLALAMDVQQALLPATDPTIDGLDIAGRSTYCDETGGDYYDFIDVSAAAPGTTLVVVGDVMGHGVASALLMASARAALRSASAEGIDLAALLGRVNRVLSADTKHGRFMTMLVALISVADGSVRWASAAHDPIISYDPALDAFDELEGGDLPLGVFAGERYSEHRRDGIAPGTILVLGTDGIWETRRSDGEMFGKDRLRDLMRDHGTASAADLADAIDAALLEFRGAERVLDDITYVVVRMAAVGAVRG